MLMAHKHGDSYRIYNEKQGNVVTTYLEDDSGGSGGGGSSGASIFWAVITSVEDSNNYQADIYSSYSSYVNGDSATESSAYIRVPAITDNLAINDELAVVTSTIIDDASEELATGEEADAGCTTTLLVVKGTPSITIEAGMVIKMTSGSASGDIRQIESVDGANLTLASALSVAPAELDTFNIYAGVGYEAIQNFGVVG